MSRIDFQKPKTDWLTLSLVNKCLWSRTCYFVNSWPNDVASLFAVSIETRITTETFYVTDFASKHFSKSSCGSSPEPRTQSIETFIAKNRFLYNVCDFYIQNCQLLVEHDAFTNSCVKQVLTFNQPPDRRTWRNGLYVTDSRGFEDLTKIFSKKNLKT